MLIIEYTYPTEHFTILELRVYLEYIKSVDRQIQRYKTCQMFDQGSNDIGCTP